MRHVPVCSAIAALTVTACTPDAVDATPQTPPYTVPDGSLAGLYDPDGLPSTFPDLAQTVPDGTTSTGLRVRLREGARGWLDDALPDGFDLVETLEELDGFGLTAGVVLGFPTEPAADVIDAVRFLDADGQDVGFETWWTDEGRTAVLEPLFPLTPDADYAVVVPAGSVDVDGTPYAASVPLHDALFGDREDLDAVSAAWSPILAAAGLSADSVVHGTVFHTQSVGTQDAEVVALLHERSPQLVRNGPCVYDGTITTCPATLEVADVVGADRHLDADEVPTVQRTYTLEVDVHLPGRGDAGPYRTLVYGHGLAGDKGEARGVARMVAPLGVAVVATDAPNHGSHPTVESDADLLWALQFFGVDIGSASLQVRKLRDNFRLAAFDRVQLVDAILAGFDALGDGGEVFADAPPAYAGHSLGGVMGVQLLALSDDLGAAYLSVPGGRVSSIVHRGQTFAPLVVLMKPPGATSGDVDRFFPFLQTAIERGEPAVWAAQAAQGRDVLVQQVIDDDIIPNEATRFLARALHVEHVGAVLQEVTGLATGPALPVAANVDGHTRALFQYDTMRDEGVTVDATHSHIFGSDSNTDQFRHWLQTWLDTGTAEVIDPDADAR
ncbi:MAG: hypothetical protein H6733_05800 [Alphaproteobacteria bacterium]|nr:hypothetical protein [Alphaproteobacteria bacterium]